MLLYIYCNSFCHKITRSKISYNVVNIQLYICYDNFFFKYSVKFKKFHMHISIKWSMYDFILTVRSTKKIVEKCIQISKVIISSKFLHTKCVTSVGQGIILLIPSYSGILVNVFFLSVSYWNVGNTTDPPKQKGKYKQYLVKIFVYSSENHIFFNI